MRLFLVAASCLLMLGCAGKERAGDITLANQPERTDTSSARGSESAKSTSNMLTTGGSSVLTTAEPLATKSDASNSGSNLSDSAASSNAQTGAGSSSAAVTNSKLPARITTITRTKPECKGKDCPVIKVKRLSFTGQPRFNAFLDQIMASMVEIDANRAPVFQNLAEFATYFWKISKPRDEVVLEASVKRGDDDLVVVQLDSYIFTGGAHGLSTTQYINWLPKSDKLLSLETMLLPRKMPEFMKALEKQHTAWLLTNPLAIENPKSYKKKWPFVPNDNAALLEQGIAVTYDAYSIAPYSFGRPTLIVPYSELKNILHPELFPK